MTGVCPDSSLTQESSPSLGWVPSRKVQKPSFIDWRLFCSAIFITSIGMPLKKENSDGKVVVLEHFRTEPDRNTDFIGNIHICTILKTIRRDLKASFFSLSI